MKAFLQPQAKNRAEGGSVLVTTVVLAGLLGLTLGSYLYWVRTQDSLVVDSQAWNAAMAYAEAGIEEGMAQINVEFGTNYTSSAATNWGGGVLTSQFGPRKHAFANGSYSTVIVPVAGDPGPTLISTGYARVPVSGRIVARTVRVTTTTTVPFGNAITVKSNLTAKGTGLMIDSFDSSDPDHSTNGMYNPATRKAGGDVNSTGGIINVQNAEIYGKVRTGPDGTVELGNGSVGDTNWNVKGQIQKGWYANDFNMEFKEISPPYTTGLPVVAENFKTNTIYTLGSGTYFQAGDFVLSQNEMIYVSGVATFYVTGNFNMKSQNACTIEIAPGGSLRLFVGTPDGPPVSAFLTQVNTTGNAYTFQFYGLESNTVLTWNGNNNYVGTIYAPEADMSLGGGGSSYFDYQGSAVAKSATLNGHFNVHYDENLSRIALPSGYTVSSWREI